MHPEPSPTLWQLYKWHRFAGLSILQSAILAARGL